MTSPSSPLPYDTFFLQIDAKRSVPQEQKPRSKKIFVGGLAPDTDEGAGPDMMSQMSSASGSALHADAQGSISADNERLSCHAQTSSRSILRGTAR